MAEADVSPAGHVLPQCRVGGGRMLNGVEETAHVPVRSRPLLLALAICAPPFSSRCYPPARRTSGVHLAATVVGAIMQDACGTSQVIRKACRETVSGRTVMRQYDIIAGWTSKETCSLHAPHPRDISSRKHRGNHATRKTGYTPRRWTASSICGSPWSGAAGLNLNRSSIDLAPGHGQSTKCGWMCARAQSFRASSNRKDAPVCGLTQLGLKAVEF